MLAHRIRYHCNYAMGKYKVQGVCVCVCVRVCEVLKCRCILKNCYHMCSTTNRASKPACRTGREQCGIEWYGGIKSGVARTSSGLHDIHSCHMGREFFPPLDSAKSEVQTKSKLKFKVNSFE